MLIIMLSGNLEGQTCLPDGITFSTQEEIDSFSEDYPGCTQISGHVIIQESTPGAITNLEGLSQITGIGDYFMISNNTLLENLSGLGALSFVTDDVIIQNNTLLTDLSSLEQLPFIGRNLIIINNESLTSLEGLNNVSNILGQLRIVNNSNLLSLSGLNNVTSILNDIYIEDNLVLEDLAIFENLSSTAANLHIVNNDALESIGELGNITSFGWSVTISENASLLNLSGLESLVEAPNDLIISGNENLQDFLGLSNLTSVQGNFEISNNPAAENLAGLESLTTIGDLFNFIGNSCHDLSELQSLTTINGSFLIADNDSLVSLNGLQSLTSIGFNFYVSNNKALQNLSGLEGLTEIAGEFRITANITLQSLEGLNNLTSIGLDFDLFGNFLLNDILDLESLNNLGGNLDFQYNSLLSTCNAPFICDYILNGGIPVLANNAEGCNEISDILEDCLLNMPHSNLVGNVYADFDINCVESEGDELLDNWLVNVSNEEHSYTLSTDENGNYWLPLFEGEWEINVISPSSFWTSCFSDSMVVSNANGDTLVTDFIVTPQGDCAFIDWELTLPILRICDEGFYVIDYCNYGTQVSTGVSFSMEIDDFLTIQSASVPYTTTPDGTIIFEIDPLDVFECDYFSFSLMTDCDNLELNDVLCIDVGVMPDDLCSPDEAWDESTIVANGTCANDSIYFQLENIGTGDMQQPSQFKVEIVIDDIVLLQDVDDYQLPSGEIIILSYALEGNAMRLETNQSPGHPMEEEISVVVPNCDNIANNIILNELPTNNGNPYMESVCGTVIGSYDPNIKSAKPNGLGVFHEIEKDWELEYTIQFQNTGTDTAFLVVIKDTLSEHLDLNTLRVGGGTHPFTWALNQGRELVFTFENILLPDSTTNEPGSHGLVDFSISPRSDLLPGDLIENRVGIYFDFNEPVITNTVFHTINKPVVGSSEHLEWCAGEEFLGQEIWQDTSLQILTEFIEYDSLHFIHLDVAEQIHDTVAVEVVEGAYFENILILGDTSFTINYSTQNLCDSLVTYFVDVLTGLEKNLAFRNTKAYPNPFNDFLYVTDHQNNENQEWTLINHLGVVVWKKRITATESLSKIDGTNLPPGVYWLSVKTNSSIGTWKVIKR